MSIMISTEGKLIVWLGATGRQGGQVVRHLLNHGWRVRAIARKPESKKAIMLKKLGADIVKADFDDIYKEVMGKYPSRFPMPRFFFEVFVGKDIPNMWRWLDRNEVSLDTRETYRVLPEAMTVRTWLLVAVTASG
jgi:hypothetical protein